MMVNDDKPFLEITANGVLAYGSPWSGKHGLATNICVPLEGICLLHRGRENEIHRIDPAQIIDFLYHQTHSGEENSLTIKTQKLVDALVERIPVWEMHCNRDADTALISYNAMSGEKT